MSVKVLGCRIDTVTEKEALSQASAFLEGKSPAYIFTPNAEMLVSARKDGEFLTALNQGRLNLCDSRGVELLVSDITHRIPGTDFMLSLCALAEEKQKSIYLLGSGDQKTLEQCAKELQQNYPKLKIVGMHPGPIINDSPDKKQNAEVLSDIIKASPDILFVAFGHGKQEKWIVEYVPQLSSIKIAMGVGGAFDFIGQKVRRAPRWMRAIGLEWLWRLCMQPWRLTRIIRAVIIFPLLLWTHNR